MSDSPEAHFGPICDFDTLDQNPQLVEALAIKELSRAELSEADRASFEVSLALALMFQRRLVQARDRIESMLVRFPEHPVALWCDALLSIYMQEPWAVALKKFQARWAVGVNGEQPVAPDFNWDGSPLRGRRVWLAGEGGRGDQIQFLRFARLLKAAGAGRVTVSVRPDLVQLAQTAAGVDAAVPTEPDSNRPASPIEFDTGLTMMSAPGLLNLDHTTIPSQVPYLHAPQTAIDAARRRLANGPGRSLNVGVCRLASKKYRSLPLELFRPLAEIPGVRLFSLAEESWLDENAATFPIVSLGSSDILADAGAICALDLVISVDTMIAHLAGSLARPVWLTLIYFPDCRWGLEGETTHWYPTMRMFRRETPDWKGVIARIAQQLTLLTD